jgi:hypothetical protein
VSKKSDARRERKRLKVEKFEQQKQKLLQQVQSNDNPRIAAEPLGAANPRVAPHIARLLENQDKQPKATAVGSRFNLKVTWCTKKADLNGRWSWGEERKWTDEEWAQVIEPPFLNFAQLTWQEVDKHASESGHKMHHGHEISDLVDEAQLRWIDINLGEFDTVFRFRIGGTKRVWGYIVQAHFHIVWWDRHHSIYPTEKA